MDAVGLDYSGDYEFVETRIYLDINHEIPPKEQALVCDDCHTENGRIDFKAFGYTADPMKVGGRPAVTQVTGPAQSGTYYLTHSNKYEDGELNVTVVIDDNEKTISFQLTKWPADFMATGIEKFAYNLDNKIVLVNEDSWTTNVGIPKIAGFGNFSSNKSKKSGGTDGINSPLVITLEEYFSEIPPNNRCGTAAVHINTSDGE